MILLDVSSAASVKTEEETVTKNAKYVDVILCKTLGWSVNLMRIYYGSNAMTVRLGVRVRIMVRIEKSILSGTLY